ncbi:MAG TPA: NAD(P)/FAD-dependent oxidoreductase [Promineifilum sp.]
MKLNDVRDVVVIGGGPAGSSCASFLAMKGHRVTVLEKEEFPREHVGESLLPFCYNLFDQLGVLDEMKKHYVRKPGVRFVDVNGVTKTTWCFNHVIHDHTYLSFQVARANFDKLLLDNSRRHGAHVEERTKVDKVNLNGPDGLVEVQATGPDGEKETHYARFLLDCSGRSTFLANMQGIKKKYPDLDRTALWTHYEVPGLSGGLEEGLSLIVYVGGEKKGWLWIFPLGPNWLTVGVVMNNTYLRSEKTRLQQNGSEDWRMDLFLQELDYSPFAKKIIEGGKQIQPLFVEGDYSYFTEQKYGDNYAMVGDAAQFIDPIFSSGVYLAINSGRLVTDALHARLSGENGAGADRLAEAYQHINGAYKMVGKLINFFYSANTINFAQMGPAQELIHDRHKDAMAVGHFLLAGDFFDRYEHYGRIIDLINDDRMYGRYKKLVNEREDFIASTCGVDAETAFHDLIKNGSSAI